jgi:hypothetical protein
MFDVNQNERLLPAQPHLGQQVHFIAVFGIGVWKNFFVEKLDTLEVEFSRHAGEEQFQEFSEECGDQIFEQSVVVHSQTLIPEAAKFNQMMAAAAGQPTAVTLKTILGTADRSIPSDIYPQHAQRSALR